MKGLIIGTILLTIMFIWIVISFFKAKKLSEKHWEDDFNELEGYFKTKDK